MNNLLFLIIASIVALIPIFLIKQYILEYNYVYLIIAYICYLILIYFYIKIFKTAEVSNAYILLQIIQILIVTILAIYLYNETMTTNKILGIMAGLLCIYFLNQKN